MKITELKLPTKFKIAESRRYLYEGLDEKSCGTVMLWENAGNTLVEAALTADQINQIFAQAEQGMTGQGANRSFIGKGVDVAKGGVEAVKAVNQAWENLKTQISNSRPVKGFDQKVSDVLSKIGMGAKDPQFQGEVSNWVQKYRDFATKHPIIQGAVYATLIALAGLSGAGVAGAAALGLLKMADKLLQGERFTSAAYSGVKTGATAYAAGQIGNALKGSDQLTPDQIKAAADQGGGYVGQNVDMSQFTNQATQGAGQATQSFATSATANLSGATLDQIQATPEFQQALATGLKQAGNNPIMIQNAKKAAMAAGRAALTKAAGVQESIQYIDSRQTARTWMLRESLGKQRGGVILTNEGVDAVFEGIMDWLKQKGKNLTTKVTADKLKSAWTKAGMPNDSEQIAALLQKAGVGKAVIDDIYSGMNVPTSAQTGVAPSGPKQGMLGRAAKAIGNVGAGVRGTIAGTKAAYQQGQEQGYARGYAGQAGEDPTENPYARQGGQQGQGQEQGQGKPEGTPWAGPAPTPTGNTGGQQPQGQTGGVTGGQQPQGQTGGATDGTTDTTADGGFSPGQEKFVKALRGAGELVQGATNAINYGAGAGASGRSLMPPSTSTKAPIDNPNFHTMTDKSGRQYKYTKRGDKWYDEQGGEVPAQFAASIEQAKKNNAISANLKKATDTMSPAEKLKVAAGKQQRDAAYQPGQLTGPQTGQEPPRAKVWKSNRDPSAPATTIPVAPKATTATTPATTQPTTAAKPAAQTAAPAGYSKATYNVPTGINLPQTGANKLPTATPTMAKGATAPTATPKLTPAQQQQQAATKAKLQGQRQAGKTMATSTGAGFGQSVQAAKEKGIATAESVNWAGILWRQLKEDK